MINKKLEKLQPLRHRVAVYVPGTNGVNTAADNARYVKMAAATLSNLFGGATATTAANCNRRRKKIPRRDRPPGAAHSF